MTSALELAKDLRSLEQKAADGILTQEDIEDTLEGIEGTIGDKLDRMFELVAAFEANQAAMKARKEEAAKREAYWGNQVKQLKSYAETILHTVPKNNVTTPLRTYFLQKGRDSIKVEDVMKLPEEYTQVAPVISPLMDEIKAAIKDGKVIDGVHVVPGKVGLRTK